MKGLFFGLGSVGQRHLRNVRQLLGADADLLAYRSSKARLVIQDGQAKEVAALGESLGVREFRSLDEAFGRKPDFAVISSPSSVHARQLACCLENGVPCLVEKPMVSSLSQISESGISVAAAQKLVSVGYQFRYHPAYQELKRLLEQGILGEVRQAIFHWGTYLPYHHPYEDYRESYAARADLGGGALNGLSHDIDLLLDLFGPVACVSASRPSSGILEMSGVEESAKAQLKSKEGADISLFLSYADKPERHFISLEGRRMGAECDLEKSELILREPGGRVVSQQAFPIERNELFLREMQQFFKCVREGGIPTCDFRQGVECIRLADEIRGKLFL